MAASGWRWGAFERAAADLAAVGRQLLFKPDRGEVGILATVDGKGRPRLAPVCPIFSGDGIYLSIGAHTPKFADLQRSGTYALHAQVGADDLEFQIRGGVRLVDAAGERAAVIEAIPFPSYNAADPIFELLIDAAVVVTWPERTTRGQKRVWHPPKNQQEDRS